MFVTLKHRKPRQQNTINYQTCLKGLYGKKRELPCQPIFLENLLTKESINKIEEKLRNVYKTDLSGLDDLTASVTNVITNAAEKAFRKPRSGITGHKVKKYAQHFDKECVNLLHQLKNMSRKLSRDPKNYELGKCYSIKR